MIDPPGRISPAASPGLRPSRGPFRWIAYALAVTSFGAGLPTPWYAIFESQFVFSTGVLATVFGAYTAGVLLTMFFVAPLSDAVGRRPVLELAMLLTAVSGLLFLAADSVGTLIVARVVSGLAVGATTSTATAHMAALEPNADQHHVARVSVAANFGGVAVGVLLSGFLLLAGSGPARYVFLALVAASVLGAIVVARTPETVVRGTAPVRVQRLSVPTSLRLPFGIAAGGLAACYALYGFFGALAPSLLRGLLGPENLTDGAILVALMFGSAALIQLGLGQVRDRRALLVGLPLIIAAVVGLLLAFPLASVVLLAGSSVVLGIGVGYAYMGAVTLADRIAPVALRGEILSAFFVVGYLALAVPTIGVGLAADRIGLGPSALLFGIVLAAFALLLFFVLLGTPTPPGGEGRPRSSR